MLSFLRTERELFKARESDASAAKKMYKQNTLNRKIVKELNESMWTDLSAEEVGRENKISSLKSMVIGLTSDVMTNKDLEIESNEKQSTQYSCAKKKFAN